MSRVELPIVVTRVSGGNLIPVVGAAVAVTDETGAAATVYAGETGSTTQSPVESDSNGRVTGYVEVGHKYTCSISHADITTYTEVFAPGWQGGSSGKCVITTEESRASTTFGLLTTPDRVSNIILPTDGLIFVAYDAQWEETVHATARAAIFLGSNQLKTVSAGDSVPAVQQASLGAFDTQNPIANAYRTLHTIPAGLTTDPVGGGGAGSVDYPGHVTTGQIQRGFLMIFAAAGTYDISVQFKVGSETGASVTVKNRVLRVWSRAF